MNTTLETSSMIVQQQNEGASYNKKLLVSWEGYDEKMMRLKEIIDESGWEFDQIVCIARGGLLVGLRLSHLMNKPLAVISASSYEGENEMERGKLSISISIAMTTASLGKRILLLDDLVDSGLTLMQVQKTILDKHTEVEEIRTGVIWNKPRSEYIPDYIVESVTNNTWIYQPFEKW